MAIPTYVPTEFWALSESTLAAAIADCPGTQDFLGVADADAAKAGNMNLYALPPPSDGEEYKLDIDANTGESEWSALHPYILLGTPGDEVGGVQLFRRSSPDDFGCRGTAQVLFASLPDLTKPLPDQQWIFMDQIALILKELTDRGDKAGFLHFSGIELQQFFRERPDSVEDLGEVQHATCFIPWGDETED